MSDLHPEDRPGITHSINIGGTKGYLTANYSDEGTLHEVFVHGFGKLGSTTQGWTDSFCIMLSLGLQNGLRLRTFAPRLVQMKFEPNGYTDDPRIPFCYSIPDYVCRWLAHHFGDIKLKEELAEIHQLMSRKR
jgi:ribonucleoside-diphosphate reductase alpha chain